jgi:hypothetical protein
VTGRLGLVLEALQLPGVEGGGERQDLEGHPPAQGDLFGLVDDAHAAAGVCPANRVPPTCLASNAVGGTDMQYGRRAGAPANTRNTRRRCSNPVLSEVFSLRGVVHNTRNTCWGACSR